MRCIPAVVLAAVLLASPGASAQDEPAHHRIDLSKRFQTIDHFGASDCWTTKILETWSEESRTRVADLLFSREKGIGLSLWRFNIGAGRQLDRIKEPLRTTESFESAPGKYDWSRMAAERWMLRAAKKSGVARFLAFSLSGTPRMTLNGFVNADPGTHTVNLKRNAEAGYARYLADVVEHFDRGYPPDERIAFDWISPFNEPQWGWNGGIQEGTRASNADVKRVAILLDDQLRQRSLTTRVHLTESGCMPDMTAPNAEMTKKYGVLFGDYVDAYCGDKSLRERLDKTIGYHAYWSDGGDVFGKHLRVAIDGAPLQNHAGLIATAYHDAAGGRVVVVYVNSGSASVLARLDVGGDTRRPKTQRVWVTSAAPGDDLRALEATAAGETLTIPGRALVTVVLE